MKRRLPTLALCAFATFIDGYDIQALGLAVPAMAESMAVAPTAFTLALSGSLVGMAGGAFLLAPLADRFGRKAMLVAMLLLIAVTTAGAATADSPSAIGVWRILTGLGMGALPPLAMTMAAENAPEGKRTFTVAAITACAGLGMFFAGLVTPAVEASFGWRGIFGLGAALPFLAAVLFVVFVAEEPVPRRPQAPQAKYLSAVSALFTPQYRLRTVLLCVTFFLSLFSTYALISWLPTLLESAGWARGDSHRGAGFMALGSIVGGLVLARAADRGHGIPALAGAYAIAAIALLALGTAPTSKLLSLALILTVGAGSIGAQLALGSFAVSMYPADIRATAIGFASGMGRLGSIMGPLAFAATMLVEASPAMIIGSVSVPMTICALCVTRLPGALQEDTPLSLNRSLQG